MFEEGESRLFLVDPEDYVVGHGLAIGICDAMETDNAPKVISLVFIDCEEKMHPVMLHPQGDLIKYLLSEDFRNQLQSCIDETVDNQASSW